MRARWHAIGCLGAAAFALGPGVSVAAEDRPEGKPLNRTPYQFDDDAVPTPVGFFIGTGMLFVVAGAVVYVRRRRRRDDAQGRWLAVHPGAHDPDETDPWLIQDARDEARTRLVEIDNALGRDPDRHERIDRRAKIRVDFVGELDPVAGEEDRVVVRIEAATRTEGSGSGWLRRWSRKRRFAEFWTLARRGTEWALVATEADETAPRRLALGGTPPWGKSDGRLDPRVRTEPI